MDTIDKVRARTGEQFLVALSEIREAGTDSLAHFGNNYAREGGLSLQQNPEEFAALLVLLNRFAPHMRSYLEIGSASGGTARLVHRWTGFEYMCSIDDGKHPRYGELAENFSDLPIKHLRADSHSDEAKTWLGDLLFDVVFIDGDHTADGVWQDVQLTRPHWEPSTLVVLHDIVACHGVNYAWLRGAEEGLWVPIASYVGQEKPLGIGVGLVL